ncbi:MAG: D-tyrosyl-tRNA(Tyr) deacylase [Flavobacteriales bacterium]|nr:D-tyrosyl-tRNA(Tyr) deacylase [Flavobacteriales bacterium]
MRVVIQRVLSAEVMIAGKVYASIGKGLLILLGIEHDDNSEDISWLSKKIAQIRLFNDGVGIMNLSVSEVSGELLVVSQFTLHASTRKGNRPSYIRAARPEQAIPLYGSFCEQLRIDSGCSLQTGVFGADMQVGLINDGPVTILIDSKNRE